MNELGASALQEGDLEAAGARLNLALEYNPEFVEAVTNLAARPLAKAAVAELGPTFTTGC